MLKSCAFILGSPGHDRLHNRYKTNRSPAGRSAATHPEATRADLPMTEANNARSRQRHSQDPPFQWSRIRLPRTRAHNLLGSAGRNLQTAEAPRKADTTRRGRRRVRQRWPTALRYLRQRTTIHTPCGIAATASDSTRRNLARRCTLYQLNRGPGNDSAPKLAMRRPAGKEHLDGTRQKASQTSSKSKEQQIFFATAMPRAQ